MSHKLLLVALALLLATAGDASFAAGKKKKKHLLDDFNSSDSSKTGTTAGTPGGTRGSRSEYTSSRSQERRQTDPASGKTGQVGYLPSGDQEAKLNSAKPSQEGKHFESEIKPITPTITPLSQGQTVLKAYCSVNKGKYGCP